MTATEECAEHCDAASGMEAGVVPIAVWILVIQFAAQLLATCYPSSELAARTLQERRLKREEVVKTLHKNRRLRRKLRRRGVPEKHWDRIFETVYDQSVRRATSGLVTAIWHDGLVHADPTLR